MSKPEKDQAQLDAEELGPCSSSCPPNSDFEFHSVYCPWRLRPAIAAKLRGMAAETRHYRAAFEETLTEIEKLRKEKQAEAARVTERDAKIADSVYGFKKIKSFPLGPDVRTLVKLGSILVHVDEGLSKKGHPFDLVAISGLLNEPDVRQWLTVMDKLALLPLRRDGLRYWTKRGA